MYTFPGYYGTPLSHSVSDSRVRPVCVEMLTIMVTVTLQRDLVKEQLTNSGITEVPFPSDLELSIP